MKIWVITDYKAGHEECLRTADQLEGDVRLVAEVELRGYMLRRYVQHEKSNRNLPELVLSASPETEHAAVNMHHEIWKALNVKIGVPKSKPHYRAFDLVVSSEQPVRLRLAPEEESRV